MSEERAVEAARLTDRDLQALIDCYADNRVLFRDQVVDCLKELQTARAYLALSGAPGSVPLREAIDRMTRYAEREIGNVPDAAALQTIINAARASSRATNPTVERPSDIVGIGEYSADQQRVAEYIVKLTGIGGGDDPIGFLMASHAVLVERLRAVERPADPRGWQAIESAPKDGATVEVRGVMLVHHMQGAKFSMMPGDWRPETPQTEWRLTDWREVAASNDQAALSPAPKDREGG